MKSGLPIDVHKLVASDGVESLRVEYKAEWNHVCGSAALQTVCAFANDLVNVGGGYIVLGVEEQDGRPILPARGLPPESLDSLQIQIQGQVNRLKPSYSPMIVPERLGEAHVLVIWCPGGDGRPYEAPESLASKATYRAYVRTNSQTREAKGDLFRQLREVSTSTPFDDRACYDARVDDLDPALLQQHLVKVGSRLSSERDDLADRARRLNLLKRTNGHEVPRNVALLFFSEEPKRWFHGASIEVSQLPRGRSGDEILSSVVEGPLPTQVRLALDQLRGLMPAEIRKHGDRAESDRVEAWPFAAVEEALVNAVHHRGYDVPDPIKVTILPDALEIVSYPGPMPGLLLADVQSGQTRPVPSRNRRIAELLKDLRLAEARGTGLARIRLEMARNGSPAPVFDFDEESRSYFQVRLPIHPAFLRSARLARPAQPLRVGRPAPPTEVVGREELVTRILRTLKAQSVLLFGPRGRGVSTLLGAVAASISDARVFQLDLAGVSLEGFRAALMTWVEGELGHRILSPEPVNTLLGEFGDMPVVMVLDNLGAFLKYDHKTTLEVRTNQGVLLELIKKHVNIRIVAALSGATEQLPLGVGPWESWAEPVAVPPLDHHSSIDLALRLLLGCHLADDLQTAELIADLSAGIPELIVRLVGQLNVKQQVSPDAARDALENLGARRADPTGLRGRVERIQGIGPSWPSAAGAVILGLVAADPAGARRLDLVAGGVSAKQPRSSVLRALSDLELDGWLVEVDGLVRFDHPWIREAWLEHHGAPLF